MIEQNFENRGEEASAFFDDKNLYSVLKNCTSRDGVREVFCGWSHQNFPPKQKFDCTERILYIFRKEKTFFVTLPQKAEMTEENETERTGNIALGQAIHLLRELKYGDGSIPLPPYICAVCKGEAFIAETKDFARFYARKKFGKAEKYDWDRTPSSPCPKLLADLAFSSAAKRLRIFHLDLPSDAAAFSVSLCRAQAVQLSVFNREKKEIDENNFLKVYEYWASLFTDAIDEQGGVRKLAEYFLADIEDGKSRMKNGRIEFIFGGAKETKSLPVYEYNYFWSLFDRVKDEGTVFAIRRKIDRLSEDFARRFEGEFYTPIPFACKAYEYIEKTIGKRNLENGNYRIWDMAAGSGNLEFTLPSAALPYTYISTLNEDDANYCRRIFPTAEVFQYDYLNEDIDKLFDISSDKNRKSTNTADRVFDDNNISNSENIQKYDTKMPARLRADLENPKIKWLIFINPPFATGNLSSLTAGKTSKNGVADTQIRKAMLEEGCGETGRELFSQFLFRISREFAGKKAYLGLFSTLKYLNAPNDKKLRDKFFRYTMERGFIFSSENFAGSKGKFPVAFAVWNMEKQADVSEQTLIFDVFNREAQKVGTKRVYTGERNVPVRPLSEWVTRPPTKYVFPPFTGGSNLGMNNSDVRDRVAEGFLCSLMCCGNDFQHQNQTALFSGPQASAGAYSVTKDNFEKSMVIHAVRKLPKATWSNNRDRFFAPDKEPNEEFYTDCVVWSAFADSNNTCSLKEVEYKGRAYRVRNQLFPFTQKDVCEWNAGLAATIEKDEGEAFLATWLSERARTLSADSSAVMAVAREFYSVCYAAGGAKIWDEGYSQLKAFANTGASVNGNANASVGAAGYALEALKRAHRELGKKLLSEIYRLGFIAEDVRYFGDEE